MASDEPGGQRPAPVVLRIKLRYDDVDAMVQRFAPNVGKSGLFLPTKSLQAVGAEVKFELRLANDTPVLVGLGRVKAAKAPDPQNPKAAFGMAIELMRVTRESREVILKMLERRKVLNLPDVGIPHPADIDAARQLVDTGVKESAAVPAPATMIDSAPVLATQINPESGPVLTAPRRTTGPLAVAKAHAVAPLEPEAPRKKRAAVAEVIERASGPIVASVRVPGLDDDVDVAAVLARARALATGNLDDELEALRESSAAPIEIGIEAASAELAKQLGGAAVRRDRSAKWAPPPSVSTPVEAAPVEVKADAPVEPPPVIEVRDSGPALEIRASEPVIEARQSEPVIEYRDSEPVLESRAVSEPGALAPGLEVRDSAPIIDVDPDPDDDDGAEHEVDAEQIADEIHQLGDGDVEEVEHTMIGAMPAGSTAFEQHVFATEPGVNAELERSLDQHLADAEAEADDLGLAKPSPEIMDVPEDDIPEEDDEQEIDDFEILAEADAEDADLLTSHGEQEASGGHAILAATPAADEADEPAPEMPYTPPAPIVEPAPAMPQARAASEERSADDHPHIPARIRAQHRRVSGQHAIIRTPAPVEPEPEPEPEPVRGRGRFDSEPVRLDSEPSRDEDLYDSRPSLADFAARLDLSDEFEAVPEASETAPPFSGRHASLSELDHALGELDPRQVSAGHALAAFEEDPDEPSAFDEPASFDPPADDYDSDSAFTLAGVLPSDSIEFDAPHAEPPSAFPPLHAFDQSDVIQPSLLAKPPGRAAAKKDADSYDLETALEALDVDLDDLSIPQDAPPARPGRPVRAERVVPKRAETDIPIDFDDFDED